MKRVVTFSLEQDGRKRVQSISAPLDETKIDNLPENTAFIDSGYVDPVSIDGKKTNLYFNSDTGLIDVEYSDIQFEDLDPMARIDALKKENAQLKADNELTQEALMEVYEMIVGGEE